MPEVVFWAVIVAIMAIFAVLLIQEFFDYLDEQNDVDDSEDNFLSDEGYVRLAADVFAVDNGPKRDSRGRFVKRS